MAYGQLSNIQRDGRENLLSQMDKCPSVSGKQRLYVEDFLTNEGICDLSEVSEQVKRRYRMCVYNDGKLSDAQKRSYLNSLEPFIMHQYMDAFPDIRDGIILNQGIDRCMRHKIGTFLMESGICSPDAIDYDVREKFEQYLKDTVAEKKAGEYLKGLDKVKLDAIRRANEAKPFVRQEIRYDGKKLFLCYHPNYETAMSLYFAQDKTRLVYDFPSAASETICRQTVDILNWIFSKRISNKMRHDLYLMPFHRLFQYCVERKVEDMLLMEACDIIEYRESLAGQVGTKEIEYKQIVYAVQRYLFCSAKEVRWDANSWFLERFNFKGFRMNPARPISRLSFWPVENMENRELFKVYIKYELGITGHSIESIRSRFYSIREFLVVCDRFGIKVKEMGKEAIDEYASYLESLDNQPGTFNKSIIAVYQFWAYITAAYKSEGLHIPASFYLKKASNGHHDLSVSEQVTMKVVEALKDAPEHLRLMFLMVWAIGLRINEVCTVKADAFMLNNERTHLRSMQYKMKCEKDIPIPEELYHVMSDYIIRTGKRGGEYVFTRSDGLRPYDPGYFSRQINKLIAAAGISREEYRFRAHGYRHGVATRFHMAGVAIQAIRDYLGHRSDEMTKQYIDYVGEQVRQASYVYFEGKEKGSADDNKNKGS